MFEMRGRAQRLADIIGCMQSVIEALKAGDAKTRLAIAADIVSILGVSLATVVGGTFALNRKLNVANILGTSVMALLALAGASLVVLIFLSCSSWLRHRFFENAVALRLLQLALWSVFGALFLLSVFGSYEFLSSVQFVQPA